MSDIFDFKIYEDMSNYDKHRIKIEVSLIGNNIRFYIKEINRVNLILKKIEDKILRNADLLNKGKFHKRYDVLDSRLDEVLEDLITIINLSLPLFPENKDEIQKTYFSLIKELNESRDSYFEGTFPLIEDFYFTSMSRLEKKLTMCEKLKLIENKILKALVTFDENGFDTHFTKYHLNLEEFSGQLHEILKRELETKFIADYKKLEIKHDELIKNKDDTSKIILRDFLIFNDNLMQNYSKLKEFPDKFVKAQVKAEKIEKEISVLFKLYSGIETKFGEIYSIINSKVQKDNSLIYLKVLSCLYEFKLVDFLKIDERTVLDLINEDDHYIDKIDYISIGNLLRVEPKLAKSIIKFSLEEMKKNDEFEISNYSEGYLLKKSKKNYFAKNQYFSHEILVFAICPEPVKFKTNKYMRNQGFDRVFVKENVHRLSNTIFSEALKKKIKYEFYIQTESYFVNISN